jgi:hypothetical protein
MAKRNLKPPKALGIEGITDVYSVNDCVSDNFADFVDDWKHNGFWFFDSPEIIRALAADKSIDLGDTTLFITKPTNSSSLARNGEPSPLFPDWTQPSLRLRKNILKALMSYRSGPRIRPIPSILRFLAVPSQKPFM